MKKTAFILSAIVTLSLSSHGGNKPKTENNSTVIAAVVVEESKIESYGAASIVGTWKLADVDLGMAAPAGKEKVFEDMKKDMIAKTVYTFGADNTITMESNIGKSSGTYSVKGNVLTTVVGKNTSTATIKSLTANELILVTENRGTKTVMKFKK